jgi:serine kinase of HPr protein (carbohydrate metabolism regulator)
MILHAGLIARMEAEGWRGLLIEGASGSGKSDLALRAIDAGWALVADDRTLVWACAGRLYGRAVPPLAGLIEARGVGVVAAAERAFARIDLAVRCIDGGPVERMPQLQTRNLLGLAVPCIDLHALEASAPAKLAKALSHLGLPPQRAYQASRAGSPQPAAGGDP